MQYRAVANRCAIDLSSLPISREVSLSLLQLSGFRIVEIDVVNLARECIGRSTYCRGVSFSETPAILDCSGLIKWVYAQKGVWIPRLTIQQFQYGKDVPISDLKRGDVIFTPGKVNYYDVDPSICIGHVGLATGEDTVIHAVSTRAGVVELPVHRFIGRRILQGIRRFANQGIVTVEIPNGSLVEWSDDIKWILLQNAHKLSHP